MPRRPQVSLAVRKIVWKLAAADSNYESILRQIDSEMEKEGLLENAPEDARTIKDIIKGINDLKPEFVINQLPKEVWGLRSDYKEIKRLADKETKSSEGDIVEKRDMPISGEDELLRNHDKKIFNKSNAILNEKALKYYLIILNACPHRYYSEQIFKCDEFLSYFNYESNQYINVKLRQLCNNLCDAIDELRKFTAQEFVTMDVIEHSKLGTKFYPILEHNLDWECETNPEFKEFEQRLDKLVENTYRAYNEYRASIRDTLYT